MLQPRDITTFNDAQAPPGESPYVAGRGPTTDVRLVSADPSWASVYGELTRRIEQALGARVLALEHVGSTSVPGLAAKPIIDVDLTVADGADEPAYVPALEQQGFELLIREPWWYGHRLLLHRTPRCNLHVWSPQCPEPARHVIFRDWLRTNPAECALYLEAKQDAAQHTLATGGPSLDYNARKESVIREIYGRAFAALGLI